MTARVLGNRAQVSAESSGVANKQRLDCKLPPSSFATLMHMPACCACAAQASADENAEAVHSTGFQVERTSCAAVRLGHFTVGWMHSPSGATRAQGQGPNPLKPRSACRVIATVVVVVGVSPKQEVSAACSPYPSAQPGAALTRRHTPHTCPHTPTPAVACPQT